MALKESSLREERLWPSAQKIKGGEGSREEHAALVNAVKPVRPYSAPVPPASDAEVHDALSKDKKPNAFAPRELEDGTPVAVRLDIPAYEQKNTWVVSVHHPKSDFTAGPIIGYDSVAHIDNPKFGVHPTGALNIASGKPKSTIATVHGNWRNITPADASEMAGRVHHDPEWRQVGMDPERHSYFYDRETQQPVLAADEALHIGPLVYAKNPVYDNPENYKFADGGSTDYIPHDDPRRESNFQKWFGKSTAIDGKNNPLVHYHLTKGNFSKFIPGGFNPDMSGPAIWLTPHAKEQPAGHNTVGQSGEFSEGANVMPLYVKIEKPLHVDDSDPEGKEELRKKFGSKSYAWPMTLHPDDVKKMKDAGYDGIYHMQDSDVTGRFNPETGEGLETIVFHGSQLKSATGNDGGFRSQEEDITKADGGEVDADGITAYHGSPHDFEQFDTSKIGTGEGAQAYGHGLYFAENENIAKRYRDTLSKALAHTKIDDASFDEHYSSPDPEKSLKATLAIATMHGEPIDEAIENLKKQKMGRLTSRRLEPEDASFLQDDIQRLENWKLNPPKIEHGKGHMYEVHIKADPKTHFLDWDAPLSEQPEAIRRLAGWSPEHEMEHRAWSKKDTDNLLAELESTGSYKPTKAPARPAGALPMSMKGSEIYDHLHDKLGAADWPVDADAKTRSQYRSLAAARVAQHLSSHGIRGIKYLDAGSRGPTDEPTRNYVVFDHSHVSVKRKYAKGGMVEGSPHPAPAAKKVAPKRKPAIDWDKKRDGGPIVKRALMVISRKA